MYSLVTGKLNKVVLCIVLVLVVVLQVGVNIFIIDDPVKNNEQAMSQVYRDKTLDWFQSVATTRLAPESYYNYYDQVACR